MEIINRAVEEDEEPFLETDASVELQRLISQTVTSEESCAVKEYLTGDDDLPICVQDGLDIWDNSFLQDLVQGNETTEKEQDLTRAGESDGVNDMEEDSIDPPSMKIESYKEAVQALEDVQEFLYSRGHSFSGSHADWPVS